MIEISKEELRLGDLLLEIENSDTFYIVIFLGYESQNEIFIISAYHKDELQDESGFFDLSDESSIFLLN